MPAIKAPGAARFVPADAGLAQLQKAAGACQGCDLYRDATQTVFGEGDEKARVMLLGEQPGDMEDRRGHPFVGPAGGILSRALEEAGIDRSRTYITNAIKHFKFTRAERGKKRLHKSPNRTEILACRPWLLAELRLLQPEVLVCLGATAAKSIFGPSFRITRERGRPLDCPDLSEPDADSGGAHPTPVVVATVHPSAVLRAPDDESRHAMHAGLVADLRVAADALT